MESKPASGCCVSLSESMTVENALTNGYVSCCGKWKDRSDLFSV
jgi:hypothetical protein